MRRSLPAGIASLTAVSQGVLMLDLFTTVMVLAGLRMLVRMYHEEFLAETSAGLKRFLIVGAGDAGEALLREIMRMRVEQYDVVGFIDDDRKKIGRSIHGVPVLGGVDSIPQQAQELLEVQE